MTRGLLAVALCAAMTIPAGGHAERMSPVNDMPILDLLGDVEGPDGYDEITGYARIAPPKPVSTMTISEVVAFQGRVVASGSKSSAMGRYQFIRKTLKFLVDRHRVDGDRIFDRRTQDYLARMLLNDCGFYSLNEDPDVVGDCLARTWAALPVMTGVNAGRSYYHGIAGNRSLTTVQAVRAVLSRRFETPIAVAAVAERRATPVSWPDDGRFADKIPLR